MDLVFAFCLIIVKTSSKDIWPYFEDDERRFVVTFLCNIVNIVYSGSKLIIKNSLNTMRNLELLGPLCDSKIKSLTLVGLLPPLPPPFPPKEKKKQTNKQRNKQTNFKIYIERLLKLTSV